MEKEITIASTTDEQPILEGVAAEDQDAGRATAEDAFRGYTQSEDGNTFAYEHPDGSERSRLLERLAELQRDEPHPPVDVLLSESEPETAAADVTPASRKSARELAEEDALRHAREIAEESHRLQMTREFGGQWIQEGQAEFAKRVDELTATIPNFRETMAANKGLIESIEARAAIAEAVNYIRGGADVAYWLTQHPDQAQRLMQLPDNVAVAQIGQWAQQLYSPTVARRASTAPAPINPLRGTSKSALPLDQADYQTYKRVREQQVKGKYRR